MNPGLEPEVGYSLDYEYSVAQSPQGGYFYVKWWDDGPISRADPRKAKKSVRTSTGA